MGKNTNLRVLSGIQPSGRLHLGNYFGMMSRMIKYQSENELFCFIADYHALTTIPNSDELRLNTFNAACDFLALGLDPMKSTFWIQSSVPQVTELAWIISSHAGIGLLDRATSYKDKISQGIKPNVGLYSYPVLMAADILLFDTNIVPVGKDQKQHLEISREIAKRFNSSYGEAFIVPKPDIKEDTKLIPGVDGKKMSKSYDNVIPIFESEKEIKKSIMHIVTDNAEIDTPKNKDTTLFKLYTLFSDKEGILNLTKRYDNKGLRYGDVKKELYEKIMDYFRPYRQKREELLLDKSYVYDTLQHGAKKASQIADGVLDRIKSATGLNFGK